MLLFDVKSFGIPNTHCIYLVDQPYGCCYFSIAREACFAFSLYTCCSYVVVIDIENITNNLVSQTRVYVIPSVYHWL